MRFGLMTLEGNSYERVQCCGTDDINISHEVYESCIFANKVELCGKKTLHQHFVSPLLGGCKIKIEITN